MYRVRLVLAGDLVGAWANFGELIAHINLIALLMDMSITGHLGIAIAYGRRIRRRIQKLAQKMLRIAYYYFDIRRATRPDIKAGGLRGFEFNNGIIKKWRRKMQRRRTRARMQKRQRTARHVNNGRRTTGRHGRRPGARNKRITRRETRQKQRTEKRNRRKTIRKTNGGQ